MQVELRDGAFDYTKLQSITQTIVKDGNTQSGLQRLNSTFRAGVPQLRVIVDRSKVETLNVAVGDVFAVLSSYMVRATSTSSTSSGACSRSMCKRTRNTVCDRAISKACSCAARTARWCRWAHSSKFVRWSGLPGTIR